MSWNKDASERRYIWPYTFSPNCIRTNISAELFDGDNAINAWTTRNYSSSGDSLINNNATWNIYDLQNNWEYIKINTYLSAENNHFKDYISATLGNTINYVVNVLCPRTRYRRVISTNRNGEAPHHISFNIPRDCVFGEVTITPEAILSKDIISNSVGIASKKGTRIANGYTIFIQPDEPRINIGGGLKAEWREFPDYPNAMYELSLGNESGTGPRIYINSRHHELKSIIDSVARRGNKAYMRDSIFASLATDIWMQLADYSAERYQIENEDFESDEDNFSARVLLTLAKRINKPKEELIEMLDSPASRRILNKKIQHWMQLCSKKAKMIKGTGITNGE